ncbi:MAG TPA: type II toxin-antitoxin system RelE/ParE family toxin [Phycisphaerae bacterium]|nr:type II toxin-antitoxin system RelE/ParE family toxin [Phycisphaerae bacterium]
MTYTLHITDPALADIDQAYSWIASQSPEQATSWYNGLVEAVNSLKRLPKRCPIAPESEELPFEARQYLYGDRRHAYRIIFTIHEQLVLVLHVRHAARRYLSDDEC